MASSLFGKLQFIYLAGISLTFIVFIFSYNDLKIIDVNVNVIDLSKPLQPESVYENVSCRKSAKYIVETTLCVNDYRTDYVSRIIWSEGVFENNILEKFTRYLSKHPDWLVIDLGANIGQYTLFAAKLGNKVVAVEPFHDNILRIHKASQKENTFNRITLIKNAVSNKRNEIKLLENVAVNIGGQSLYENRNKIFEKNSTNKYLVETILFDDIVPYLPYKNMKTKEKHKQAILKVDIESFEIFAFEHASLLFATLDIRYVFMEWGHIADQKEYEHKVIALIDFFYERDYEPFGDDNILLEKANWKKWTFDIMWRKI